MSDLATAVRVVVADDAERYRRTSELVWFTEPESLSTADRLRALPPENRFAATVPGGESRRCYAGIYGVLPLTVGVPGMPVASVSVAGLTWVGVHPDARRAGVLTAMMRHHLVWARAHGRPISLLHASEPGIYGRFGYGPALSVVRLRLSRRTELTAPGWNAAAGALVTTTHDLDESDVAALLHRLHRDAAATDPGIVAASVDFYRRWLLISPEAARGFEPTRVLLAESGSDVVGAAIFRRVIGWSGGVPDGSVDVDLLVGTVPARLALLRRLLDMDLTAEVDLPAVSLDDPLVLWLGPRVARNTHIADNTWVRIVDLPTALSARGYHAECDLVLEVADDHAPWNAGRWRVSIHNGEARVVPTDDPPELRISIAALGSAYLGGGGLSASGRAGLVGELRPGASAELDAALRGPIGPAAAHRF